MKLGTLTVLAVAEILSFRSIATWNNNVDESVIFSICSIVLEETEWNYMSIASLDLAKVELSENFMKSFHNQVPYKSTYCFRGINYS